MTTLVDDGTSPMPQMLQFDTRNSNLQPSLVLALRDMRLANGRDPQTGAGPGNGSWVGLSLAMIVLDTLSGSSTGVRARWEQLLTSHRVSQDDATVIYELRCSVLHGYGLPKPGAVQGRNVLLTSDSSACAVETPPGVARISVPVFCGWMVERIAAEAPDDWDVSQINTSARYV